MKKQMTLSLVVFLLVLASPSLIAQSITPTVLSPAGNDFSNASFSVSSTFGEMTAIKTIGSTSIITQGFHQQPDLATTVTVTQLDLEGISLYPNPTKGLLTLSIENANDQNYRYRVYNIIGELVMQEEIAPGLSKIDISKMVKGVYFVKVTGLSNDQQKTIRITLI